MKAIESFVANRKATELMKPSDKVRHPQRVLRKPLPCSVLRLATISSMTRPRSSRR